MDFAPSLGDEVFTIDIPKEYNEATLEEQLFNQEMIAVTLYNPPDMETDATKRYLSQG
ncbi:hypothetical protein C1H46_015684 [Malus baccata]|uniref:Uncharacterized protein n=1 Tax=Malus baccata TaxID=106549 RepID=A0A540MIU7_MALBA|nr:hypothetical protein C1H46_015684 [Malus baccata]